MEGFQLKSKKDTIGHWNTEFFEGKILPDSDRFLFETNDKKCFELKTTWNNPTIDLNCFVGKNLSVKGKIDNLTLTIMALEVKDDSERTTD